MSFKAENGLCFKSENEKILFSWYTYKQAPQAIAFSVKLMFGKSYVKVTML